MYAVVHSKDSINNRCIPSLLPFSTLPTTFSRLCRALTVVSFIHELDVLLFEKTSTSKSANMRFSTATIIAFIGMSNALPTGTGYGSGYPPNVPDSASQVPGATSPQPTPAASPAVPQGSTIPQANGGGSDYGSGGLLGGLMGGGSASGNAGGGLDLGGLLGGSGSASGGAGLGGLLGGGGSASGGAGLGGLLSGLMGGGAAGSLDVNSILGQLGGLLKGSGYMDASGKIDADGLFGALKAKLKGLPGGDELSAVCDQLKTAFNSGKLDLNGLISGVKSMASGGKFDLGSALGIDVGKLTDGLKQLCGASGSGAGALNLGSMVDKLEAYVGGTGGVGADVTSMFSKLKALVGGSASGSIGGSAGAGGSASGSIGGSAGGSAGAGGSIGGSLDISALLDAAQGFLTGKTDLNGFVSACGNLPGGQILVSLYSTATGMLKNFGIDLNAMASKITSTLGGLLQGGLNLGSSL
jgi:hypothetical protein